MPDEDARSPAMRRDDPYWGHLKRLLKDFKRVADQETHETISAYADSALSRGNDIKTAYNNARLLITMLAEMAEGNPYTELRERVPENRRRKRFKTGVAALALEKLSRNAIRRYFAQFADFGKTKDVNYRKTLRHFLRWWKAETEAEAKESEDREEEVRLLAKSKRIEALLEADAMKDIGPSYRDKSGKPVWTADDVHLGLEALRSYAEAPGHPNKKKTVYSPWGVRDEAIFSLLWESGLRPFELVELNWEDVAEAAEYDGKALYLHISNPDTTGRKRGKKVHPRQIVVVECVPQLRQWMRVHPTGRGLLFTSVTGSPLANRDLNRIVKVAARGTKPKYAYSYALRDSRMTWVLERKLMTIEVAADYFGTSVREILATYRRTTMETVNRAYARNFPGLVKSETEETGPRPLAKRPCPSCRTELPHNATMCNECGQLTVRRVTIGEDTDRAAEKSRQIRSLTESIRLAAQNGDAKVVAALSRMVDELAVAPASSFTTREEMEADIDEDDDVYQDYLVASEAAKERDDG